MKKLFAVLLALTLVLSMGTIALAAETGTITIDNAIKGSEYNIYKMLNFEPSNAAGDKGVYTIVDGWAEFFNEEPATNYFTVTDNAGKITVTLKTEDTVVDQTLAKAAIAYAKEKQLEATATKNDYPDDKTGSEITVVFDKLALGYYAIDTSLGTMCALTPTNINFKAYEKNQKPEIDKEVLEDKNNTWGEANDADIDQIIEYRSTITVGEGATNYVMHDTMEAGLTFNYNPVADNKTDNDVVVKLADGTVVNPANYTVVVSPDDGHTFDVVFDNDFIAGLAKGTQFTVYYYAYLNENAEIAYDGGNVNEVYLTYGEDHTWETGKHYTSTYTWKIDVLKYTETDENPEFPLAGAKFELLNEDGEAIKFSKDGNTYKVDAEGTVTEIETDSTGKFEIIGLDEGQYALHETKAPDGYNKLAEDIEVTVESNFADPSKYDTTVTYSFAPAKDGTIKVKNNTGSLLPETGGIGTTIFYVVGGLLMAAAFILLVSKKRMASFA